MKSPDHVSDGEFKGMVTAHLESIGHTLDDLKKRIDTLCVGVGNDRICLAKVKTKVMVLWLVAGAYGLTLLGLTLKLLLGGPHDAG